ncbi:MAG: SDR family oxidoreductase [Steroidobacteraceae bacterium]
MQELAGKVALVTGGAKNIGRAIAFALADAGANIAIVTRKDQDAAEATVAALRTRGVTAEAFLADVADEAQVNATVAAIVKHFGRLDILVNNAAVRTEVPFAELSFAEWRRIIGIALDGAFLCAKATLSPLAASGAGTIINIGGMTAYTGGEHRAHVIAAKAGLDGLTRALAVELAPQGINVNLVSPGLIETVRAGGTPQHHKSHGTLVGRRGTPEEVASIVRYLAGPGGRYITGQTIHVNGGAYLG